MGLIEYDSAEVGAELPALLEIFAALSPRYLLSLLYGALEYFERLWCCDVKALCLSRVGALFIVHLDVSRVV